MPLKKNKKLPDRLPPVYFSKSIGLFFPPIFPVGLIFLLGLVLYAHILHAPSQIDDHDLLFGNPLIKDLPEFYRQWYVQSRKALTLLTFAINYYFSKEDTFSYHLVNVFLHIGTACLLYYFVKALRLTPGLARSSLLKGNLFALFAALIFLVHPLQTQAVSYLWQRSEVLSGFFYMAALLSYLTGRLRAKKIYYVLTMFLYGVGFFAKGTIVTLPLMIFLIEFSFFQFALAKKVARRIWPYLAIGAIGFIGALQIPLIAKAVDYFFVAVVVHVEVRSTYLLTQLRVLWKYVGLAFLPINQNIDHDILLSPSLGEPVTFLSFLGLIVLVVITFFLFKRHRLMAVGIVWFFIYLLPTSIAFRDPMWEHRLYFSLAGFSIFLTAGIFTIFPNPKTRILLAVSIISVFSILTFNRNTLWRSPVLLLEDAVKKSPRRARPHLMLGDVYLKEGQIEKASEQFQIAIALDPAYADPYNNMGLILFKSGNTDKAITYFERAIALQKDFEAPYINLAYLVLYTKGDRVKAERLFKQSLVNKETLEGFVGLGNLYLEKKDYENACEAFLKALKLSHNNPVVFYSLGNAYYHQKDYQNALAMYNKTIELDQSFADAYYNIGMIYYETKEFELSYQWIEKAFQQRPRRLDMCQNLIWVNEALGETTKAEEYRQQCRRLSYELSRERK